MNITHVYVQYSFMHVLDRYKKTNGLIFWFHNSYNFTVSFMSFNSAKLNVQELFYFVASFEFFTECLVTLYNNCTL